MPIITIDKLVIGPQQEKAGLIVHVTVTGDDRPDFITATFSDQEFNTERAINKQITIFADAGTDVSGNQSWSTEAILSESDMLELFPDGDFTKKVQVSVYKGTVNATQYDLVWKSAVKLLSASAVPGAEKITVTVDLSPHYVNENLTAQVTVCESDGVGVLQPVVLSAVIVDGQPSKTRFTGEIINLQLGKEYELHVAVENHYGVSESLSLISVMTSLDPGSVTIKNFDSLDSSGAVFDFTINAFDYSAYNSLKLLLDFKKNDSSVGTQEIIVDICGVTNPDGPNSNQSFDMNGIIMSTDNKNAIGLGEEFVVVAKLEGEIAIDANGQELRDYTGDEDVETYIMDENMGIPDVTLADIDWVTGSQTVKAVIEGSFNDVSFLFDLNGNESIKTTYDISDNKMTATKIYSFEELNHDGPNVVVVRASRPEVNGGDSVSTSGTGALEFNLKAIKREPLPTVSIDINRNDPDTVVYDIKFGFTNIPDLSYSDVFASVEHKSEEVLSGNALRDISGNATITLSDNFEPGERYIAKGYNRFNLSDAGFNERYKELNDNSEFLLSAYVMNQFVATGKPELFLEVRPETSSNELKVVRMSGDLKGNHVSELIVYARDVCGNITNETYSANTNSIPPELLGNFFHDFHFNNEISIKEGDMFLVGIIDTPTGFDGIKCKEVPDPRSLTVAVGAGGNSIATSPDGITWTGRGTSIFSEGNGVAYNGFKWVAVGKGTNSIATSPDGITWTGRGTSIFSTGGYGVAWNGTLWVAVGSGTHTIATSPDGITWTGLGKTIFSSSGYDVAWNGTLWVAVGYGTHTIATSYDGITWTGLGNSIFSYSGQGVAWNGTLWVAVGGGDRDEDNTIATSPDGITWTGLGNDMFDQDFAGYSSYGYGVAWNGTLWVAVGQGTAAGGASTTTIATSPDGITWTPVNNSNYLFYPGYGVDWNGTLWVAVGGVGEGTNTIATSPDGITWTGLGTSIFSQYGRGVAWNGTLPKIKNQQPIVAVGQGTNSIATSYDGITWTGLGTSIFSWRGRGVAWNGTWWVAVGSGTNSIATSPDGITWTGRGTSIFTDGNGVAWNGTLWVAVGYGINTIATSPDGITWTGLGKTIFSTTGRGVAWNGTLWVAVGYGTNTIATSPDGITWTPVNNSNSIFSSYGFGVAWNGTLWVAVGTGTNTIATSPDGITWTPVNNSNSIFSSHGFGVAWNGTLWVAVGSGTHTIAYSYNGITWTPVNNSTSIFSDGFGVAWNGTLWVAAVAGTHTIATSPDGITWTGRGKTTFSYEAYGVGGIQLP